MNEPTDQQLLREFAERRSEAAFASLVRRHIDLVYSTAIRMTRDTDAAKDATQGTFIALAADGGKLIDRPSLAGWLHATVRNLAAKAIRSEIRRRAREQEAATMNELLSATSDADWEHIAPHLDDALAELSEPEREAVLLRYFKNHDLRTVGATLGISDDAAQKRVSRAVERLRELFAKRGITIGASSLVVLISANAVQSAPVGLVLTISTAAALTGTTFATTATITTTKALAMTALQKTIVAATVVVLAGAGFYEARQAPQLRARIDTLQQRQESSEEGQKPQNELFNTTDRAANFLPEHEQLTANSNEMELLKLRGEVTALRKLSAGVEELQEEKGRISISGQVSWGGMREQGCPSAIAPKCFQAHQCFISFTGPELSGAFETTLVLPTGRFDRAAAQRFASSAPFPVTQPIQIRSKVIDLLFHFVPLVAAQVLQLPFQIRDDCLGAVTLQIA